MIPPVWDVVNQYLPRCRPATKGWTKFNGICCHHRGHRMDSGERGGIIRQGDLLTYHCFNCSFKAHWRPGFVINGQFRKFLEYLNVPDDVIKRLNFKCWQYRELNEITHFHFIKPEKSLSITSPVNLPENAYPLTFWIDNDLDDVDFIDTLEYLASRNLQDIDPSQFYWSPDEDIRRRLIIPMKWNADIVGYQSRAIDDDPNIMRYIKKIPSNYIYNNTLLYDMKRTNLFLVEGIFDAIGLNCLSVLGNNVSEEQAEHLNSFNKDITVVPDLDPNGIELIEQALENDWYVSFPHEVWPKSMKIKDAADAIGCFGRLFTIWSIMKYRTNDRITIQMLMKKYYDKQKEVKVYERKKYTN